MLNKEVLYTKEEIQCMISFFLEHTLITGRNTISISITTESLITWSNTKLIQMIDPAS
jgi:hypothetical protein